MGVDQGFVQPIGPRSRRLDQPRLELGGIDPARMPSGVRTMNWMRARIVPRPGPGIPPRCRPALPAGSPGSGAGSRCCSARAARRPGTRRTGRTGRAEKQADLLPFLQMQDLLRDLEQLLLAGLEQLVARIGVENVGQCLAEWPARRQVRARDRAPLCAGAADAIRLRLYAAEVNRPRNRCSPTTCRWGRTVARRCSRGTPGDARSSAHSPW